MADLEPEINLLDLVRQYAIMHTACVNLTNAGAEEPAEQHHKQELTLFSRIEAEVQRLGENDATGDLQAQRDGDLEPTAERIILRLRRQLSDARAEVERLKAELAAEEEYCGNLGTVLGREGSVTVEMAPPREPRTWDVLEGPPVGLLKVRDAQGDAWEICSSGWTNTGGEDSLPWSALREFRGPLTEVFDA